MRGKKGCSVNMPTKQELWQEMAERCKKITDGLGMPLDEGISETVVALNVLGIHTTGSCEGHLDHGVAAPWIDIAAPDTKEAERSWHHLYQEIDEQRKAGTLPPEQLGELFARARALREQIAIKHQAEVQKLLPFLTAFYESRRVPYEHTLAFCFRPDAARFESIGAELQENQIEEQRAQRLQLFQEEMRSFTAFLKDRFFASSEE